MAVSFNSLCFGLWREIPAHYLGVVPVKRTVPTWIYGAVYTGRLFRCVIILDFENSSKINAEGLRHKSCRAAKRHIESPGVMVLLILQLIIVIIACVM